MAQGLDIDASGGDIRGHQDPKLPCLEARQGFGALGLRPVPVDALGLDALAIQERGQTVCPVLGTGEDEGIIHVTVVEELHQQRTFQARGHRVNSLLHTLGRSCPTLQGDLRRIPEDLASQRLDRRRHGGAEEERLLRGRHVSQDPANVGQEAHVQHAVGLVQDQVLEPRQGRVAILEVVQEPPWSGDDDVGTLPKRPLLRAHRHASVHCGRAELGVPREPDEVVPNLERQLPGGSQDQRAGRAP